MRTGAQAYPHLRPHSALEGTLSSGPPSRGGLPPGFALASSGGQRDFQLLRGWASVLCGVHVKGLRGSGSVLSYYVRPSSLLPLCGPEEDEGGEAFSDCASFYYQQEGSFCNLCMKFMSFPGERRGLTGEGGGHAGGAG